LLSFVLEKKHMPNNPHYKSKKHREWRAKVLRNCKYLCEECKKYGRKTEATHAHHKKPVEEYPELAYVVSNGEGLCTACHNKVEPRS
jgi:5-methylcytosine-specific restriction enzyme A